MFVLSISYGNMLLRMSLEQVLTIVFCIFTWFKNNTNSLKIFWLQIFAHESFSDKLWINLLFGCSKFYWSFIVACETAIAYKNGPSHKSQGFHKRAINIFRLHFIWHRLHDTNVQKNNVMSLVDTIYHITNLHWSTINFSWKYDFKA